MDLIQEHLRSLIYECVRKHKPLDHWTDPYTLDKLFLNIAEIAKDRDFRCDKNGNNAWTQDCRDKKLRLHNNLRAPVAGIVWDLICEGVFRPGSITGESLALPTFHVSEYGQEVISGSTTPHDPDGFLRVLCAKVPTADSIIVRYIGESAETFRRNCLLSSTVALGCACEKAFLLLSEQYSDALKPAEKAKFDSAVAATRGIKQHHQEFMKCFDPSLRQKLRTAGQSPEWLTEVENALTLVFQYVRRIRNDAGHPTGTVFPKELVHSHLVVFPHYLSRIYDLIQWLAKNKPL